MLLEQPRKYSRAANNICLIHIYCVLFAARCRLRTGKQSFDNLANNFKYCRWCVCVCAFFQRWLWWLFLFNIKLVELIESDLIKDSRLLSSFGEDQSLMNLCSCLFGLGPQPPSPKTNFWLNERGNINWVCWLTNDSGDDYVDDDDDDGKQVEPVWSDKTCQVCVSACIPFPAWWARW